MVSTRTKQVSFSFTYRWSLEHAADVFPVNYNMGLFKTRTCLLFTTLMVCDADIRPAGWLDKVVDHWKKSFVDDFEQLGSNFNLDATIESKPPGYQDSPDWDFDSVSRLLALLSVSEKGQPALNSLRRMIAPTRRMMMDVPGLAIPQSLYKKRRGNYRSGMNQRSGMTYNRKRTGNNRMDMNKQMGMANNRNGMVNNPKGMANNLMGMANNRNGMANNRKGMANNRKGMANNRKGMANNRMAMPYYERMGMQGKTGRKQMIEKRLREERELSAFQMSFRLFPSIKDTIPNDIYYDGERDDYEDASPEYDYVDPNAVKKEDDAIVVVANPVEARLPSARISVKLLKEILQARANAARAMVTKKTTQFAWLPTGMPNQLGNETSDDNSTAVEGAATGAVDGGATTDGTGGGATTPGEGAGEGKTETGGGDAPATEAPPPPPEGRKMAAKTKVAAKSSKVAAKSIKVAAKSIKVASKSIIK